MSKKRKILGMVLVCILIGTFVGGMFYVFTNKPDMTSEQLTIELQEASLPIDNIIVYDEQTDWNKLLGRPNQYVSKVNFADTRLDQTDPENPNGGTIETFNNASDLNTRKIYNESVMNAYPIFKEYIFVNGNHILRLSYDLTNDQANEYKEAFMAIK